MGKSPSLKGIGWPIFVKAFVTGYTDYIRWDLTGKGVIANICIPNISQVCGIPMVGVGAGTII
jgi:hypothetical protein